MDRTAEVRWTGRVFRDFSGGDGAPAVLNEFLGAGGSRPVRRLPAHPKMRPAVPGARQKHDSFARWRGAVRPTARREPLNGVKVRPRDIDFVGV